ncbi:Something about silencing SAS complex subunit 4 [Aspergillus parasiticus SU-1]|uniref:Something about silencing, SAS, complex subunit 4-domain-containing protein n=2 Tax=Aspergillus parasiticus TaxID=5067 RepID=A0A5N6E513_ASPPA|nr:something about silencing, SAS, complex subunit 4-domain-containing protein [Aspergillus parasiticus]KJK62015.1 Something about silencing SAS complex subunit 4 [Aspergillus parasiticus SU-1]
MAGKRESPRIEYGNDGSQSIPNSATAASKLPQREKQRKNTLKIRMKARFLAWDRGNETDLACRQFPPLKSSMTSTVMAVRSSLRVSVRQEPPNDHDDNRPSPSKRPRLNPPPSSRRRKSSPDLLDTTTVDSPSKATPNNKVAHIRRAPSSLPRRSSARRPLLSPSHHHPPSDTPHATHTRLHRNDTPAASPSLLSRESPDPLDTISPATTDIRRYFAKATPTTTTTPSTRRHRVADSDPPPESATQNRVQAPSQPAESPNEKTATPSQQPTSAQTTPAVRERRSLRSHDGGSRARSELALYFPNYEQLLSLEPPKTEFLAVHTAIKLIDDHSESPISSSDLPAPDSDTPFGNPLLKLHNCESINLPEPQPSEPSGTPEEDPLNEGTYFKAHRRNERQEKQLRNIERERAQHEKQQLDRLLDELQNHDWLRVMGITGLLSDQEKKQYEPKRDYFIKEITALIQKFKIWKEEEKRRKVEKEKAAAAAAANPATAETQDSTTQQLQHNPGPGIPDSEAEDSPSVSLSDVPSYSEPPDINDVDAWAARQLIQEARSATAGKKPKSTALEARKKTKPMEPEMLQPLPPPVDDKKPFTSFYAKRHLRDTALSAHRKGRTRFAFGYPVPEMEEQDFDLPPEILTPEAIDSCRRKRRRMKRASRGSE